MSRDQQKDATILVPLCVDLDGTLVMTDTLWESFLMALRRYPSVTWKIWGWLLHGKAYTKRRIAESATIDVDTLPYCQEFLEYLRTEKKNGRRLVLATAADRLIAERVANHLGIFSEIIASDNQLNVSGHTKGKILAEKFGEKGFDYAGNASIDLTVWKRARAGVVVRASSAVTAAAAQVTNVRSVFPVSTSFWRSLLAAFRPHQWLKNLLIFVPLIMAHQLPDVLKLGQAGLAFIAFCLAASSLYLLNDLFDLPADRRHPRKRHRVLAAGNLPLPFTLAIVPVLLGLALLVSTLLLWSFTGILLLYIFVSLAYSYFFKQIVLFDVLLLSGLYALRLVAGAFATEVAISFWLLAFSMFFFLSLALVKRVAEVVQLPKDEKAVAGRGYQRSDLQSLSSLGTASGYLSVLVLALYINSPEVRLLYSMPVMLWLICPLLLYWISRIWLIARRGSMHDDPVIFAARDKISYILAGLTLTLLYLAV